jgi:hypothetical protein
MIYTKHLSLKQKIGWKVFEIIINKIATPLIIELPHFTKKLKHLNY